MDCAAQIREYLTDTMYRPQLQKYLTHTRTLAMRQQRERASTSLPWPSVGAEAEEWGSRSGVPEQLQQLAIEQYNLFGPRSLPIDAQIPRSPTAANIYIPTSRP